MPIQWQESASPGQTMSNKCFTVSQCKSAAKPGHRVPDTLEWYEFIHQLDQASRACHDAVHTTLIPRIIAMKRWRRDEQRALTSMKKKSPPLGPQQLHGVLHYESFWCPLNLSVLKHQVPDLNLCGSICSPPTIATWMIHRSHNLISSTADPRISRILTVRKPRRAPKFSAWDRKIWWFLSELDFTIPISI